MKTSLSRSSIAALVLALLLGCGQPELTPIPANGTILAFGDSLTLGVGTTEANSYPAVLAQLSGRRVVNAGVSGEVTSEGLARLSQVLKRTDPALMILLEGGNDILRNEPPAGIKRNLAAMIELAESRGVEVVLIGVPERSLFSVVAPLYGELAAEHSLVFEGSLLGRLLRSPGYKSDAVHFNADGYRIMAEEIFALLSDHGALRP
jgi:lysophospholipase L1-like esterase